MKEPDLPQSDPGTEAKSRLDLLLEVSDLVRAQTRDELASSDGGSSGRSDTNDKLMGEE